tara:strand:- start:4609 stop:6159 length:1551 start_codon:yes stop_codon:yes gene_type:complete
MQEIKLSNTIIAKNTMFLYLRMVFVLVVTLYTSRIVLHELGVVDFGIYTLVAGFVLMFSFFGSSLSNAAQRFLNYQYGLGNERGANNVFNMGFVNFFLLSIIVVIALETFGLWFLNNKLIIPTQRLQIVNNVFHFSVISVFVTMNSYIYRAVLIARENMAIYAYTGIFEAIARLAIAYMIINTAIDKLMLYSFMYMLVSILVCFVYMIYCFKYYDECKFNLHWDYSLFKEMFSFIGWNAFTSLIEAINQQGISITLNLFFGPIVNAARGIAFQINNALLSFSHNIYMAARPQIVKAYAVKDMEFFLKTINLSSRFTYYLLLIFAIPLILNIDYILYIWLKDVPKFTSIFSVLIIAYTLVDSLKNPLWAAAQAVGDLKRYSLLGGAIFLLNFPISYLLMYLGFHPKWVYVVYVLIRIGYLISIIFVIKRLVKEFDLRNYFNLVISPIILVTVLAPIIPFLLTLIIIEENLISLILISISSFISSLIVIFFFGLDSIERFKIRVLVLNKLNLNNKNEE